MALTSASAAITRYRIVGGAPDELVAQAPDLLKKFAFRDIDESTDERSEGWVSIENMLDPAFASAPPAKGEYLAFAMRVDTRKVSSAVLKKHLQAALADELDRAREQGKKFISKDRKTEIRDMVTARLMARTLPVPQVHEAAWNISTHKILFGSANNRAKTLFEDLFMRTFNLRLEPLTPFFQALDTLGEDNAPKLENLEATIFV